MNIRQMALIQVTKKVIYALIVAAITLTILELYGLAVLGIVLCSIILIYALKALYDQELRMLESRNALTKLKELE
jgi:hypothetical protein